MDSTWKSLALAGVLGCALAGAARAQAGWQPSVMSVRVTPGEARLQVGQNVTIRVSASDASGAPVDGVHVAFSTSDPHVATVADDGTVLAVGPGSVTITAQVGSGPGARSGRTQVRVEGQAARAADATWAPSFRSVLVTPAAARIRVGEQLQLHARAQDMSGQDVPIARFVYTSGDVHLATVSDDGVVVAVSPGKVTVTVRVGSGPGARSANTVIEVLPAQP